MRILIVGSDSHELERKFGPSHHYDTIFSYDECQDYLGTCDVVFDFLIDKIPSQIAVYKNHPSVVIFINVSVIALKQLNIGEYKNVFVGFCGMPTFIDRDILEVSLLVESHKKNLETICGKLNTKFSIVADQVGLVTPRVICMIINEAYYTLEEGTATREDIDKAMRLGTNYPHGPFEWSEMIGVKKVVQLLEAMFRDTGDNRYKVCPLILLK